MEKVQSTGLIPNNTDRLIQQSAIYNTNQKTWSVRFGTNTVFDRDLHTAISKLLKILGEK